MANRIAKLENYLSNPKELSLHESEIAKLLKKIKNEDEELFIEYLKRLPSEILGEVVLEFPDSYLKDIVSEISTQKFTEAIEELESDDATDLIQDIEEIDKDKADEIFESLDEEDKEDIRKLKEYSEDEAGAYMQTELFSSNINNKIIEAIESFRKLKEAGEVENVHQIFLVDDSQKLVAIISLEDLITLDFNKRFIDVLDDEMKKPIFVLDKDDIQTAIKKFEEYDLSVLAVVDENGILLGRITADDVYDLIQDSATEQIYNLAGVDDEAEEESLKEAWKKRATWLFINLLTAILASFIIGLFDDVISQYVALAILMPIVASMGGNAGTQTLTVFVRQLALGELDTENSKEAIKKEIILSVSNGLMFGIVLAAIATLWFSNPMLGLVIALSMVINLLSAGFFGGVIPLILKKLNIDPAVGSSVLLTTVTDVVGFFSFLGLAKVIL
jgi:magnesium transporter